MRINKRVQGRWGQEREVEQVTRCVVMSEEGDVGEGCGGVAIVGAV